MGHILKRILLLSIFLSITIGAYAFSGKPIDDANCQAAWLFTEGSGETVADSSQNSNTGTFLGAGEPAWVSMAGTSAPAYADYMVLYDGVDDYIEVANHATITFGTSDFSGVQWVRSVVSPADSFPASIGKGDTGTGEWMLRRSGQDVQFYGDAGDVFPGHTTNIDDDEWHNLAWSIDQGTTTALVYVDGVVSSPDNTFTSDFNDATSLRMGNADGDGNRFWDGHTSEAALFDDILTSTEISQIMDMGLDWETGVTDYCAYDSCQGCWLMDFDEDPIRDDSQNSNTGALKAAGEPNFATASPPPGGFSTGYYVFDGSEDYIGMGDPGDGSLEWTTDISVVFWIYFITIPDAWKGAFNKRDSFNQGSYAFNWRGGGTDMFQWLFQDGAYEILSDTMSSYFTTGTWYHVVCWGDSDGTNTDLAVWKNGSSIASTTKNNKTPSATAFDFILGAGEKAFNESGNIRLDEFAVFNRTLNSTEINDIMDNGLKFAAAPAARRRMFTVF